MKKHIATTVALGVSATGLFGQTFISGQISSDTTWSTAGNPYILTESIEVNNGATLTILPGVIVRSQPRTGPTSAGEPGSLIITTAGKINAAGTKDSPIIFTTAALDDGSGTGGVAGDGIAEGDGSFLLPSITGTEQFLDNSPTTTVLPQLAPGALPRTPVASGEGSNAANVALWGGLVILGNAPTNVESPSGAGVGEVEGLPAAGDTLFGGTDPNDNSGVLEFVSVRYGGDVLGTANELNGITLAGVGRGTKIENVEVYQNWDDGIEWFGGTVDMKNVVVTFVGDDSLDGDQGYTGTTQFAIIIQATEDIGSGGGDKPFEFDGTDGGQNQDENLVPVPFPSYQVANFSVLGNGGGYLRFRNEFSGAIYNGLIDNCTVAWDDQTPNPIVAQGNTYSSDTGAPVVSNATGTNTWSNNKQSAFATVFAGDDFSSVDGVDLRPNGGFGAIGAPVTLPETLYENIGNAGAIKSGTAVEQTFAAGWTATDLNDWFRG